MLELVKKRMNVGLVRCEEGGVWKKGQEGGKEYEMLGIMPQVASDTGNE